MCLLKLTLVDIVETLIGERKGPLSLEFNSTLTIWWLRQTEGIIELQLLQEAGCWSLSDGWEERWKWPWRTESSTYTVLVVYSLTEKRSMWGMGTVVEVHDLPLADVLNRNSELPLTKDEWQNENEKGTHSTTWKSDSMRTHHPRYSSSRTWVINRSLSAKYPSDTNSPPQHNVYAAPSCPRPAPHSSPPNKKARTWTWDFICRYYIDGCWCRGMRLIKDEGKDGSTYSMWYNGEWISQVGGWELMRYVVIN